MLTIPLHQSLRFGQNNKKLFRALTRVINEQKIRQKIMRGLNLTSTRASPRDLPTRQGELRSNLEHLEDDQYQTLTVYSRATGHVNSDSFNFTLSSKAVSIADDIQTAKLVLHLWDSRSDRRRQNGMRRRRQQLETICNNREILSAVDKRAEDFTMDGTNEALLSFSPENYGGTSAKDGDLKRMLSPYKTKSFKNCSRERKAGRKQKKMRVKIVVRSLMPGDTYKRRVSVKKTRVRRSGKTTLNLRLPSDIIKKAAQTADKTLRLQITCRKCGGHVHLDRVMTAAPGHNQMNTWLNPYRPYLFIQFRKDHSGSKERRKRAISTQCHADPSSPFLNSVQDSCCSERIWVSFEELGLRSLILYPDGFQYDVCSGTCLATEGQNLTKVSSYIPRLTPIQNSPASLFPRNNREPEPKHADMKLSLGSSTSLTEYGKSEDVEESKEKLGQRNKSWSQCGPLQMRNLWVVYIDPATHDIMSKAIPNLIQDSCGCIN